MSRSAAKRPASGSPPASPPASKALRMAAPTEKSTEGRRVAPIFRTPPEPLCVSASIEDRSSTFVARIYRVRAASENGAILSHLKRTLDASHNMAAWRILVLKTGKSGLDGPDDFRIEAGSADDGEQWGGKRALGVMEKEGVSDALVVVSRWYGGVLLGPVRFTHIEQCAREVCHFFKAYEEVEELVARLHALDDEVSELRAARASRAPELASNLPDASHAASGSASVTPSSKPQSYDRLLISKPPDLVTAQRLIRAREKTLEALRNASQRDAAAGATSTEDQVGV